MKRVVLAALLLSGCGYFNALYNARRSFEDAERAAARGEAARARTAYAAAIDKAAISYRGHPDGRWADDALYLIVRSRLGRGEYEETRVAAERLLAQTADPKVAAGARAHLGAALLRLGEPAAALAALDSASAGVDPGSHSEAFVRLWRARAFFALDRNAEAGSELARARSLSSRFGLEAALEGAGRALALQDSALLRVSVLRVLADPDGRAWADSAGALANRAARVWNPHYAQSILATDALPWSGAGRDSLLIARAQLLAHAGDDSAAVAVLDAIHASSTGPVADRARVEAATIQLRTAGTADLPALRSLLLPAVTTPAVRTTLNNLRIAEVLIERAREHGQPLALFAAGEHARDVLGAPRMARELFIAYADMAPTTEWAPKALFAAAALSLTEAQRDSLRNRLNSYSTSGYVHAVRGGDAADPAAFAAAEERLGRVVRSLLATAARDAAERDAAVRRSGTVIDSIRAVAAADSVTLVCGAFVDSLGLVGIRSDSVRVACVRGDTARVTAVLVIDTTMLLDSTRIRADSLTTRRGEGLPRRDTIP